MTTAIRFRAGETTKAGLAFNILKRVAFVVGVASGSLVLGYILAGDGAKVGGPAIILAIGFLPFIAAAMFIDPRLGLAAIPLVFPIGVNQVPKTPVEVVQLVVLGVVMLTVLSRLARGLLPLSWSAPLGWVLALFAWSSLALPSAADRSLAIRAVLALALQLLLVMALLGGSETATDVTRLLAVLVLIVAAIGITTPSSASSARAAFNGSVITGRAVGIFSEPNQLGTFSGIGFFTAMGIGFAASTARTRLLAFLGCAACALGLVLSLSRGAWIGFGFGMLVLLLTLPEARRALLPLTAALLLVAAGFGAFAPENPQVQVVGARFRSITGEKNPYDNRPAIWAEAISLTEQHPWLGAGPGSFPTVSTTTTSNNRATSAAHAHNILLTWSSEAGVPAALLILALAVHVGILFSRARRRARRIGHHREAALMCGLTAALVAVLGQGLVDYTLRNAVVFTTTFFVLGCLLVVIRWADEVDPVIAPLVNADR